MSPVNLNTLQGDLVLHISDDYLENSKEIVSLARTCMPLLGVFTSLPENAFFKSFRPDLSPNSLYSKIFYLKSLHFICTPCASISIGLFKKTTALLSRFFPTCKLSILEGSIRQSLCTNKYLYRNNLKDRGFGQEALQNFDAERATIAGRQGASEHQNSEAKPTQPKTDSSGCFGIVDAKDPRVIAEVKLALEVELNASKNEIERRILELRGSCYDGAIHDAAATEQAAQRNLNAAIDNFCFEMNIPGSCPPLDELLILDINGSSEAVKNAHIGLCTKSKESTAAKKAFSNLVHELHSLVLFKGGKITGGKLHKVTTQLADLDKAAKEHLTQQAEFIAELNQDVTFENLEQRSSELHNIIG